MHSNLMHVGLLSCEKRFVVGIGVDGVGNQGDEEGLAVRHSDFTQ